MPYRSVVGGHSEQHAAIDGQGALLLPHLIPFSVKRAEKPKAGTIQTDVEDSSQSWTARPLSFIPTSVPLLTMSDPRG